MPNGTYAGQNLNIRFILLGQQHVQIERDDRTLRCDWLCFTCLKRSMSPRIP
jgi:hypothetical protein